MNVFFWNNNILLSEVTLQVFLGGNFSKFPGVLEDLIYAFFNAPYLYYGIHL